MGTKYITIPFDLERAKRITNGEEDGKIVTRDGRSARIVCWDVKSLDPILALVEDKNGMEGTFEFQSSGLYCAEEIHENDLFLSVPEAIPNHSNYSNIGKDKFEPGQPVIGIDGRGEWRYDIFSHCKPEHKNGNYVCSGRSYNKCLPYNEKTKHLLGTTEDWEDNK